MFTSKTVLNNIRTDEVYIPREVMFRKNISDNTKLIFGIIFSECLKKMDNISIQSVSEATNALKNCGGDIPLYMIEKECLCDKGTAEFIRHELSSLIATLDIASCFYECELHYANVHKPICRLCESGKLLYKMTALVNTITDRKLHNPDGLKQMTEQEIKLLKKYSEMHSPELLNSVIDILKKEKTGTRS